jgi:hypothetical protein
MEREIWVAVDDDGQPVRAFASERAARQFEQSCADYLLTHPEPPDEETDDEEGMGAWDRYDSACERWRNDHPAGRVGGFVDVLSVQPLTLVE